MTTLRDTVKDYQDELRDGIAWVAFWKQGRSWNAEYFHLDMDDTLYPEDIDAFVMRRSRVQVSQVALLKNNNLLQKRWKTMFSPLFYFGFG